jgi:hypothetical protein
MPIANPMVQGGVFGGGVETPPAAAPNDQGPPTVSAPSRASLGGFSMGFGGGADKTNIDCAILVAGALIVIIALKVSGFRFAVDAGVTRG